MQRLSSLMQSFAQTEEDLKKASDDQTDQEIPSETLSTPEEDKKDISQKPEDLDHEISPVNDLMNDDEQSLRREDFGDQLKMLQSTLKKLAKYVLEAADPDAIMLYKLIKRLITSMILQDRNSSVDMEQQRYNHDSQKYAKLKRKALAIGQEVDIDGKKLKVFDQESDSDDEGSYTSYFAEDESGEQYVLQLDYKDQIQIVSNLKQEAPFKSEKQRAWMYATHPDMAKEWSEKTPKGKHLPEYAATDMSGTDINPDDAVQWEGKTSPVIDILDSGNIMIQDHDGKAVAIHPQDTKIIGHLRHKAEFILSKKNIQAVMKFAYELGDSSDIRKKVEQFNTATKTADNGELDLFEPGDVIEFDHDGETFTGTVIKNNDVTLLVDNPDTEVAGLWEIDPYSVLRVIDHVDVSGGIRVSPQYENDKYLRENYASKKVADALPASDISGPFGEWLLSKGITQKKWDNMDTEKADNLVEEYHDFKDSKTADRLSEEFVITSKELNSEDQLDRTKGTQPVDMRANSQHTPIDSNPKSSIGMKQSGKKVDGFSIQDLDQMSFNDLVEFVGEDVVLDQAGEDPKYDDVLDLAKARFGSLKKKASLNIGDKVYSSSFEMNGEVISDGKTLSQWEQIKPQEAKHGWIADAREAVKPGFEAECEAEIFYLVKFEEANAVLADSERDLHIKIAMKRTANDKLMKHHEFDDLALGVEWPKDSMRQYSDGYTQHMKCDYGFVRNSLGADGEDLDVYIGDTKLLKVFRVTQLTDEGQFDEYKYMVGFPDVKSATSMFLQHQPLEHFGGTEEMSLDDFRQIARTGEETKPENLEEL